MRESANERHKHRYQLARKIADRSRDRQEDGHEVGVSAITVAELEFGARHSSDYKREIGAIRKLLFPFGQFDFDALDCALHYGEVREVLETRGMSIGAMDLLIAAHARALGAVLVTNNKSHFVRVPDLKVENWLD